jgi:phospholipid/cholesterol/gamma-HCH transport system substrate-binding protein
MRRLAGVAFLLVMAAFVVLTVQVYDKAFTRSVTVTLHADHVGNQLRTGSEVKARGVAVGTVREVRSAGDGAEIVLALKPDQARLLPSDVSALLVPKTLFGERYVQLSIPRGSTYPPLTTGDVIGQDRSANAIELERVFDDLLPTLRAVQPHKLASTLSAVATALQGRGEQLGDTMGDAGEYLEAFNPDLPTFTQDLRDLAAVAGLYGDIAPDLLDALTDATTTLDTVAEQRAELGTLYRQVTTSSRDVTAFLRANSANLIRLSAASRAPLEVAARYSPSFPCTLRAMADLVPVMDRVLGEGTDEPGLHVDIVVSGSRGAYRPGVDRPVYDATGGPRCYPSGVAPGAGVTPSEPVPFDVGADDDLGLPNSPQERALLSVLLAPALGVPLRDVPAWSSVLVGPLYRGTEVTLR